jgi:hypothetical protein
MVTDRGDTAFDAIVIVAVDGAGPGEGLGVGDGVLGVALSPPPHAVASEAAQIAPQIHGT